MNLTLEFRHKQRSRFGGEENLLGESGQIIVRVRREYELLEESRPVPDVVVLVVASQREHVLAQQFGLSRIRQEQLDGQVQNLQLDDILLEPVETISGKFEKKAKIAKKSLQVNLSPPFSAPVKKGDIAKKGRITSLIKDLASFRRTSGAMVGTSSEYSPNSHKIEARAAGTVIVSRSLAIDWMISLCRDGCDWRSFFMTTTLSATTASATKY